MTLKKIIQKTKRNLASIVLAGSGLISTGCDWSELSSFFASGGSLTDYVLLATGVNQPTAVAGYTTTAGVANYCSINYSRTPAKSSPIGGPDLASGLGGAIVSRGLTSMAGSYSPNRPVSVDVGPYRAQYQGVHVDNPRYSPHANIRVSKARGPQFPGKYTVPRSFHIPATLIRAASIPLTFITMIPSAGDGMIPPQNACYSE